MVRARCRKCSDEGPELPMCSARPAQRYAVLYRFHFNRRSGSPQINNAVLIILSHLVPEHARFDDSTSGGVTVAPAADHLHENDALGTAEELKSVQEEAGARWRAKQLE